MLKLGGVTDKSFLISLALTLDAVVFNGLDIARRLGWRGEGDLWQVGGLYRVYYVPTLERDDGEEEPDEYHRGIAPSVKLLHTVVSRLVDIDISTGTEFVRRWKVTDSPIHLRLWAALSRDSRVASPNEVATTLLALKDRRFWKLGTYPEIAELRAKRFCELAPDEQRAIIARIRRLPPRSHWPRKAEAGQVAKARLYWALRELRRIEIAGASLPHRDKVWLEAKIHKFPELVQMARLDEGFMRSTEAYEIPEDPDDRFDLLAGEERLKALEAALSSPRGGWNDDPARGAADWIRQPGRPSQILIDFESVPDGGAAFARVWDRFGWAHSPTAGQDGGRAPRDLSAEAGCVLSLLTKLPDATLRSAIHGISNWLWVWREHVLLLPEGLNVWIKLWPIAVETTNAQRPPEEDVPLYTISQSSSDQEPRRLDTLNSPAGKLVGVFLSACPSVKAGDGPFSVNSPQRQMRDAVEAAIGPTGLIVKYRLIESLHYFLKADLQWTRANLIPSLLEDNSDARILWRAVARRPRSFDELEAIGCPTADRATDPKVGRETRRSLVFSLVFECLHAFWEKREPAVPYDRITQMIRSLEDEVRTSAAEAIQRFVHDVSTSGDGGQTPPSPEHLFRSAAAPFLRQVWPQERSLATPGVSRALADLPATAEGAFAEAVDAINRFLVPFECWSMLEYGLYGEEDDKTKLSNIDNQEKAAAFLRLLDLTVGTAEGFVVPYGLSDALDQIRKISPKLAETQAFRRLATAARRG